MKIILENTQVFVSDLDGQPGGKILQFVDPQGNTIVVPLLEVAAKSIAAQLTTGLVIVGGPVVALNGTNK
jgi:hypothetical protein